MPDHSSLIGPVSARNRVLRLLTGGSCRRRAPVWGDAAGAADKDNPIPNRAFFNGLWKMGVSGPLS